MGRGFYAIDLSDGEMFSHHRKEDDNRKSGLIVNKREVVEMSFDAKSSRITYRNGGREENVGMEVQVSPEQSLYFVVYM